MKAKVLLLLAALAVSAVFMSCNELMCLTMMISPVVAILKQTNATKVLQPIKDGRLHHGN